MKKRIVATLATAVSVICLAGCAVSEEDITKLNPNKYITSMQEYKGLTLEAALEEVTDEQVENRINYLLEQSKEAVEVTGKKLENGDIANINYEGKIDGVAFDGGSNIGQPGYDLQIGSGQFIPGFEDGLVGMESGETRDITVTFPEEYPAEQLAGKEAVFTVTLNAIKELKVPELTDEYIAGLGIENVSDTEGLKIYIRQQLETEAKNAYETQLNNAAMQKLLDTCEFKDEVPEERYKYYYDNIIDMDTQYATQFGSELEAFVTTYYGFENMDEYYKHVEDSAIDAVHIDLASSKILKDAGEKITDKAVEEDITANLSNYGVSSLEEFKENYNIDEYKSYLMNKKALDIIIENANIVEPSQEETDEAVAE